MATTVDIPDFNWAAFYYQEILDALILAKRTNVPEHTDESEYDPLMQFLRMQAIVGHLNNTLLDLVANESTLPTAQLPETVRNMLRLIDYEMALATPSQVDLVFKTSKVFLTATELVPEGAQFATDRDPDEVEIFFEVLTAQTLNPTDEVTGCFAYDEGTDTYTDYTTEGNSTTTPADDFTPWAAPAAKDALYIGHDSVMWDQLGAWFTTPAVGVAATGSIQFIVKASMVDGERFVLDDGVNTAVTFYFDVTGGYIPGGGYDATNIQVDISGETTAQECAVVAETAINGATALNVTAGTPVAGLLGPTNTNDDDALGDGNNAITETVTNGGFIVTGMSGGISGIVGVWEYYDGDWTKDAPTSVDDVYAPGQLLIEINSILGTSNRSGLTVRAQLNETTAYEDMESSWGDPSGSWGEDRNYILTAGVLGQTGVSTDAEDYSVGAEWTEFDVTSDGTNSLKATGDLEVTLPQTVTRNWAKTTVNGTEAFWLRFRVVSAGSGMTVPVFQYVRIDQGDQYLKAQATQGRTQIDAPLGTSDGTANQTFETSRDYFIDGSSEVTVDDIAWTEVENFLSSKPTDKHFRVTIGEDDQATIIFGDGVTGRIPVSGATIDVEYRWDANNDGNVGFSTVTVDKTSLTYVNSIWNPRPATGWTEAAGSDEDSLERAKIAGPASLRTGTVALGPNDVEILAAAFVDTDGASPFTRSKAIEEGFGPKTVELVVVVAGGGQASAAQLAALDEYFNGDSLASPPIPKNMVANQEVTSVNFTQKAIDIDVTVTIPSGSTVTATSIQNQLAQVVQPEALKSDGVNYEWEFGEDVPTSRLIHEVFETSEDIEKVVLTTPAVDVSLISRELPILGTVSITLVTS